MQMQESRGDQTVRPLRVDHYSAAVNKELRAMLTGLVGEQAAAATSDRLRARTSTESFDSQ